MPDRRSGRRGAGKGGAGKGGGGGLIGGEGAPSIFSSPDDSIIPGEVLVKLTDEGVASITASVPTGPLRATAALAPSGLGVSSVDRVLGEAGAYAVTRLHPPMPPTLAMSAEATALDSTYRIFIDPGKDVADVASRLQALAEVEDASVNRWRETYVTPNDPDFGQQWGLTRINCPAAWDRTTGSSSITVAVVDTGVDLDHPELAPLLVPGRDLVDLPGASGPPGFHLDGDFVGRDDVPQDEVGHGTHVAGTIACASNNNAGVAGVTWSCRLMPVKVLARIVNNTNPADVRGVGSAADIAAGIRWAVDHGARVINMSLGGPSDTTVERDAVAYAVAHNVVVVAAMGNEFQQGNPTSYPAAYPGVIAVGATTQADAKAPFSNTGPHIDVAAPGVQIRSTLWNDGYGTMSGTSMASPHVAGVAALVLSCNPNQTASQVGDVIRGTARALRQNAGDPVPNDVFGHGLVDAAAAVNRACPPKPRPSLQVICTRSPAVCPPRTIFVPQCRTLGITCTRVVPCVKITRNVICITRFPGCPPPRTHRLICPFPTGNPGCEIDIPDPGGQRGAEEGTAPGDEDVYDYDPYGEGEEMAGAQATSNVAVCATLPETIICQVAPTLSPRCYMPVRTRSFVLCGTRAPMICPTSPIICGWREVPDFPVPRPGPMAFDDPYGYDPYGEGGMAGAQASGSIACQPARSYVIVCQPVTGRVYCYPSAMIICPTRILVRCLRRTHPIICGWQEVPDLPMPDPGPLGYEDPYGYDPYGEGDLGY